MLILSYGYEWLSSLQICDSLNHLNRSHATRVLSEAADFKIRRVEHNHSCLFKVFQPTKAMTMLTVTNHSI